MIDFDNIIKSNIKLSFETYKFHLILELWILCPAEPQKRFITVVNMPLDMSTNTVT